MKKIEEQEVISCGTHDFVKSSFLKVIPGIQRDNLPKSKKCKVSLYIGSFQNETSNIHKLCRLLEENRKCSKKVKIYINSTGGSVSELFSIVNSIKKYKKIVTEINTRAYSAGGMLFLEGDERIVYENSSIMFHTFSTVVGGKSQELISELEHYDEWIAQYIQKKLKEFLTKKEIKKLKHGEDIWFTGSKAYERGIATKLIG